MANSKDKKSKEMRDAERVDALRDRVPTTEQSARESAGFTRRPPDGRPEDDYIGVSDTPNAIPPHETENKRPHDFSHRTDEKIQGENVGTTGDHSERQVEKDRL